MDLQFIFADIKKGNKFFKIFYHEKLFIIQFCFGSFSHKFDCMFFKGASVNDKGPFYGVRLWPRVHHCMVRLGTVAVADCMIFGRIAARDAFKKA